MHQDEYKRRRPEIVAWLAAQGVSMDDADRWQSEDPCRHGQRIMDDCTGCWVRGVAHNFEPLCFGAILAKQFDLPVLQALDDDRTFCPECFGQYQRAYMKDVEKILTAAITRWTREQFHKDRYQQPCRASSSVDLDKEVVTLANVNGVLTMYAISDFDE